MIKGDRRLFLFLLGGLFILADLILKQLALFFWTEPVFLFSKVGWAPTLNPGIAFSLPLHNFLTIFLTILTLLFFIYLITQTKSFSASLGLLLTIFGAVSNLLDRVFYQHTIDYLQVYISVFNLADVLIVIGVGLYLLSIKSREATR